MVVYLDDILVLEQSRELLLRWRGIIFDLLENLGFLINYTKSKLEPSQTMRFLGICSERNYYAADPSQEEGCTDNEGGSDPPPHKHSYSKTTGSLHWPVHLHLTSDSPSPTPLSGALGFEACHPEKGWLGHFPPSLCRSQGGPQLVASESLTGEQQRVSSRTAIGGNGNGCIPVRVW